MLAEDLHHSALVRQIFIDTALLLVPLLCGGGEHALRKPIRAQLVGGKDPKIARIEPQQLSEPFAEHRSR